MHEYVLVSWFYSKLRLLKWKQILNLCRFERVCGVHFTPSLGGAAHTALFFSMKGPQRKPGLEKKMPGMFVKLMSISRAGEKKARWQWGVTLVRIMSLHVTQTRTRQWILCLSMPCWELRRKQARPIPEWGFIFITLVSVWIGTYSL